MGRVHFTKALDNIERLSRKAAAAEKSLAKDHRVFFLFQSMLKTLNYIYCHRMIKMHEL